MCPKLKVENLDSLKKLELDDTNVFGNVVAYFNLFVDVMNLHIDNCDNYYLTPYMRMLAQVANFISINAENQHVDFEQCEQYIEGIKWALNEFAPSGMIFDSENYVECQ